MSEKNRSESNFWKRAVIAILGFISVIKYRISRFFYSFYREFDSKFTKDEINHLSDVKKAFLLRNNPLVSLLLIILLVLFVALFFWAKNSIIDEMTVGEGKIIPSTKVKKIQSLEGGIVKLINVKEAQIVKKNDLLLQIDDTSHKSSYLEEKAQYYALLGKIARLQAEVSGAETITWPRDMLIKNVHLYNLIKRQTKLFHSRKKALREKLNTLKSSLKLATDEMVMIQPLVKKGILSKVKLFQIKRQINDLTQKINAAKAEFSEEAQTELHSALSDAARLKELLISNKDKVTRTTIRSPVNGIIKKVNVSTIGEIIQPGQDIMEIVPREDKLLVEARIKPQDIGFIAPNQKALVKVTAYDYAIYGGLHGLVESIGADTITDKEGREYFVIRVRTDKNHLGSKKKPLPIMSGMTVSVHILTGKKSILDYLLKPLIKAKQNAFQER